MAEDAFEEREQSYEARYKLDAENRFKAESRRNKLLGLWAAERMGMTRSEAEAYAKEVVLADLEAPGDADVVGKVMADLERHGAPVPEAEIRAELQRLFAVAYQEITGAYPDPLGPDHRRVGG